MTHDELRGFSTPPKSGDLPAGVTRLLMQWGDGNPEALHELMPLVGSDLRSMAQRYMSKESARHVLQPTALVNELFVRLHGRRTVDLKNRAHFFGFAAQTMRIILVDHARRRDRKKRGGGEAVEVPLSGLDIAAESWDGPDIEILALHQVLDRLEAIDPRTANVVKLRYFVGMSVEETSAALEISPATVKREWRFARLWLFRELQNTGARSTLTDPTD